jgi:hypothetical protein
MVEHSRHEGKPAGRGVERSPLPRGRSRRSARHARLHGGPRRRNDRWLFELDANGSKVWEKTYAASTHGRPLALAATRDGDLVVAGYREGADFHRDGWVARFDTSGRLLMQRTFP